MTSKPPVQLGRGVVVLPGMDAPGGWESCPRIVIGDASLDDPGPVVEELHGYWFDRQPVLVELGADPALLRAPECSTRPVYEHRPDFEFTRERLQFLVSPAGDVVARFRPTVTPDAEELVGALEAVLPS